MKPIEHLWDELERRMKKQRGAFERVESYWY